MQHRSQLKALVRDVKHVICVGRWLRRNLLCSKMYYHEQNKQKVQCTAAAAIGSETWKRAVPLCGASNWCQSVTWRVAKGASQSVARHPDQSQPVFFPPPLVYLNFSSAGLPGGSKTERRNVWFLLKCQPGEVPFFQFSAQLKQPLTSNWTRQCHLSFEISSREDFSWKTEVMTFFLQTQESKKKTPPKPPRLPLTTPFYSPTDPW